MYYGYLPGQDGRIRIKWPIYSKEGGDFVEEYNAKHLDADYADELFNS